VSLASAAAISRTILYEGYALYPYRASSLKNRRPSLLGAVPSRNGDGAPAFVEVTCLIEGASPRVRVIARFLQLVAVRSPDAPPWHEAEEREVAADDPLSSDDVEAFWAFGFSAGGRAIRGQLSARMERLAPALHRVTARLTNDSIAPSVDEPGAALAAAHLVIEATDGAFVSAIDPPPELAAEAGACRSTGLFPVLIGPAGARDTLLAAPFAIGDHPKIAPESAGDLFDATEIDEILSLRILTLTDDEKREARKLGPRIRALIDRTEGLDARAFEALHGARRADTARGIGPGDRVVLRPRRRADVMDLALAGRAATVASVEHDFEGKAFVTVTVDDDPGRDLGATGQVGHRFFFGVDEVEVIG
jgi:hypothetical protein